MTLSWKRRVQNGRFLVLPNIMKLLLPARVTEASVPVVPLCWLWLTKKSPVPWSILVIPFLLPLQRVVNWGSQEMKNWYICFASYVGTTGTSISKCPKTCFHCPHSSVIYILIAFLVFHNVQSAHVTSDRPGIWLSYIISSHTIQAVFIITSLMYTLLCGWC